MLRKVAEVSRGWKRLRSLLQVLLTSFNLALFVAMPAYAGNIQCLLGLAKAGLSPACDEKECAKIQSSARMLDLCVNSNGAFRPAEVVVCINELNGASKYFPAGKEAEECGRLSYNEPAWELKKCYCCC